MGTWPLDNITIRGTQKPLTDLGHISLLVAGAFGNVLIGAKFMKAQWNNMLISWSFISAVIKPTL